MKWSLLLYSSKIQLPSTTLYQEIWIRKEIIPERENVNYHIRKSYFSEIPWDQWELLHLNTETFVNFAVVLVYVSIL